MRNPHNKSLVSGDLVASLAKDKSRQLHLLTATPHSGKSAEFNSLLGLLDQAYDRDTFDLAKAGEETRKKLAGAFVQTRNDHNLQDLKC